MSDHTAFRLASYNIRKCLGIDRRRKPGRILDVINTLDADVIALQEADRRYGARPAALSAQAIIDHTDFRPVETGADGPSLGWHGNAILLRRGLAAGAVRRLDLPGTEPRGALLADISGTPLGPNRRLRLVATHLGLLRRDRRRQIDTLLAQLGPDTSHAAILGDFNEWSRQRGLGQLARSFALHCPGRSFHAARPVAMLDRIALGTALQLKEAGVCRGKLARIASDHLPIWADVSLHDPAGPATARFGFSGKPC